MAAVKDPFRILSEDLAPVPDLVGDSAPAGAPRIRVHLHVRGIVQGVGFRPFVFKLARRFGLAGFVRNAPDGAVMELEGSAGALNDFCRLLQSQAPPLARITNVAKEEMCPRGESGFTIQESIEEQFESVMVSPDVSTCADCRREFADSLDRHFAYPFTNCANCGPRYSIIRDVPYDRPKTTMAGFRMCPDCRNEYDDPANRRFHAQPNACPKCGPKIVFVDALPPESPEFIPGFPGDNGEPSLEIIRRVRRALHEGKIVALKGLGGFHLACDAVNDAAVRELRERKRRSDKPFAVMARDVAAVESFCRVADEERKALESSERPIVILERISATRVSPATAPGNKTLGVMLPYTPLHTMLFGDAPIGPPEFTALVMTSGNLSEEPIVTSNPEAASRLRGIADSFLFHNRDVHMRVDDSVVRVMTGQERVLRRSRGYAPRPIDLGMPVADILACGAELKNTLCLTHDHFAIVSQHIGDLQNYETLVFFEETLANLKRLFRIEPQAVAYDLHPHYQSTQFALEQNALRKVGVQHHHAHVASCMAENGLREKVLGVAFDGTGYGTDGKIWGGEFLVGDYSGFRRAAHLRYVPLAGGDAGVRQPWRSALAYLRDAFGSGPIPSALPLWKEIPPASLRAVETMLTRGINTVDSSSSGRLFDAVASLLGVRQEITYEAQAAIELEMLAGGETEETYPFEISSLDPWKIDFRPAIRVLVREICNGTSGAAIAVRFHNTLAAIIVKVCRRLRERESLNKVCLSGGTFQNARLLRQAMDALGRAGFDVYTHSRVPPNDGGISLGQAAIANAVVKV